MGANAFIARAGRFYSRLQCWGQEARSTLRAAQLSEELRCHSLVKTTPQTWVVDYILLHIIVHT